MKNIKVNGIGCLDLATEFLKLKPCCYYVGKTLKSLSLAFCQSTLLPCSISQIGGLYLNKNDTK